MSTRAQSGDSNAHPERDLSVGGGDDGTDRALSVDLDAHERRVGDDRVAGGGLSVGFLAGEGGQDVFAQSAAQDGGLGVVGDADICPGGADRLEGAVGVRGADHRDELAEREEVEGVAHNESTRRSSRTPSLLRSFTSKPLYSSIVSKLSLNIEAPGSSRNSSLVVASVLESMVPAVKS